MCMIGLMAQTVSSSTLPILLHLAIQGLAH